MIAVELRLESWAGRLGGGATCEDDPTLDIDIGIDIGIDIDIGIGIGIGIGIDIGGR